MPSALARGRPRSLNDAIARGWARTRYPEAVFIELEPDSKYTGETALQVGAAAHPQRRMLVPLLTRPLCARATTLRNCGRWSGGRWSRR